MTRYTSIKIPNSLADKIRSILPYTSYRSVSEFVIESARWLLRKIEYRIQKVIQKCRWNEHNFKMKLVCVVCGSEPEHHFHNHGGDRY